MNIKAIILLLLCCSFMYGQRFNVMYVTPPPSEEAGPPTWDASLQHWWSFNEASGDLIDKHKSNDGTVTGSPYGGTGKVGDAYDFNGTSEYVTLGTGLAPSGADFTFTFWYYWDGSSYDVAFLGGNNLNAMMFKVYNSSGQIRFMIEGGGGTALPSITLSSGWNFVSMSRDGDDFEYGINGSYEIETWSTSFTGNMDMIANNYDDEYCDNLMDEMNYWTAALTSTYITNSLYNSGNGKAYEDGE